MLYRCRGLHSLRDRKTNITWGWKFYSRRSKIAFFAKVSLVTFLAPIVDLLFVVMKTRATPKVKQIVLNKNGLTELPKANLLTSWSFFLKLILCSRVTHLNNIPLLTTLFNTYLPKLTLQGKISCQSLLKIITDLEQGTSFTFTLSDILVSKPTNKYLTVLNNFKEIQNQRSIEFCTLPFTCGFNNSSTAGTC